MEPPGAVFPPGAPAAASGSSAAPIDLRELVGDEFVELGPESGLRRQVDAAVEAPAFLALLDPESTGNVSAET